MGCGAPGLGGFVRGSVCGCRHAGKRSNLSENRLGPESPNPPNRKGKQPQDKPEMPTDQSDCVPASREVLNGQEHGSGGVLVWEGGTTHRSRSESVGRKLSVLALEL